MRIRIKRTVKKKVKRMKRKEENDEGEEYEVSERKKKFLFFKIRYIAI